MIIKLTEPYTSGVDVMNIQRRLILHGYPLTADGTFGPKTRGCVVAFQLSKGLKPDGIVGPATLAALASDPVITADPSELALMLVDHCRDHIGDLYVWGADGQIAKGGKVRYGSREYSVEDFCKRMDLSDTKAQRSIDLYNRKLSYGQTDVYLFDCSGLISTFLEEQGFAQTKRNCDHLWNMVAPITRADLISGDLLFRQKADGDNYHVGVFAGRGQVIEAMGRDSGVVIRGINQSGEKYWTHCGRLKCLYEGVTANG